MFLPHNDQSRQHDNRIMVLQLLQGQSKQALLDAESVAILRCNTYCVLRRMPSKQDRQVPRTRRFASLRSIGIHIPSFTSLSSSS